jgi:hypothetical protein
MDMGGFLTSNRMSIMVPIGIPTVHQTLVDRWLAELPTR